MAELSLRDQLLRPYFFWGVQDEPGVYFFITKADAGRSSFLRVDYVGQAGVVSRRVRFGSHHRLNGDYQPDMVLYLPLLHADVVALTAAENLFIHLYRPEQNASHMPRVGPGDFGRWARLLVGCMNRQQHVALYRFLAASDPEIPDVGRPVVEALVRVLNDYLSEYEQILICQDLMAKR